MLKQPVNQVRLTNVAVMRLKRGGKRFEIACYKNKILNWKGGTETDLSEVLQTESIFINVSKGQLAKVQDLQRIFGTRDALTIARAIMEKGELQVSEQEREVTMQQVFRDVCTMITERVFNKQTGLPLPISVVENTLSRLGFSFSIDVAPKRQSLKAIELLCNELPDQIARTQMSLRISAELFQIEEIHQWLESKVFGYILLEQPTLSEYKEIMRNNGTTAERDQFIQKNDQTEYHDIKLDALKEPSELLLGVSQSVQPTLIHVGGTELQQVDQLASQGSNTGASLEPLNNTYVVSFYCNPSYYRDVDRFVTQDLDPPGSLKIISSKEYFINPNEPINKQQLGTTKDKNTPFEKSDSSQQEPLSPPPVSELSFPSGTDASSSIAVASIRQFVPCRTCEKQFESVALYRNHCRTDWHQFNVKRKFKKLPPISEEEFTGLAEDIAQGFLAVD